MTQKASVYKEEIQSSQIKCVLKSEESFLSPKSGMYSHEREQVVGLRLLNQVRVEISTV